MITIRIGTLISVFFIGLGVGMFITGRIIASGR